MTVRDRSVSASVPLPRIVLALAFFLVPAAQAQSVTVFLPADSAATENVAVKSTVVDGLALRSRLVSVDFETLERVRAEAVFKTGPPGRIVLNLFDDVVFAGIVERTDTTFSGGYSLTGRLVDEPLGTLALVVNSERVVGTVRAPTGTYSIRSVGEGLLNISEVREVLVKCEVEHPGTEHQR